MQLLESPYLEQARIRLRNTPERVMGRLLKPPELHFGGEQGRETVKKSTEHLT